MSETVEVDLIELCRQLRRTVDQLQQRVQVLEINASQEELSGGKQIERFDYESEETRWAHVGEALPDIGEWVLVSGYDKAGSAWWDCAERQSRGGGGWEWDNNEDEFHLLAKQIEFWAPVSEPPATRRKPKLQQATGED